jgi:hypothetical protein
MPIKETKELVRRYLSSSAAEINADIAGKDDYHAPERRASPNLEARYHE